MTNRGVFGPPGLQAAALAGLQTNSMARGYMDGCVLSNSGVDAVNDIVFGVGVCRGSQNLYDITLRTALTKQLDAAWVPGNNQGGLRAGLTKSASFWYHCFLIYHPKRNKVDAFFDTSLVPTLPSGWTVYRRVGSVCTDSTNTLLAFTQVGDWFRWVTPLLDYNSTSTTTAANAAITVPPGASVQTLMNIAASHASAVTLILVRNPSDTDAAPSGSASPLAQLRCGDTVTPYETQINVWSNTTSQIAHRSSNTATTLRIATIGWRDLRGRDG